MMYFVVCSINSNVNLVILSFYLFIVISEKTFTFLAEDFSLSMSNCQSRLRVFFFFYGFFSNEKD